MENQKLENLLNLSLSVSEIEREKSSQLSGGFLPDSRKWELIVKYNGDLSRLQNELIQVEELIAGYAIVTLPEELIDAFAALDEVEYVEKPKRLYFATLQGKRASCIPEVTMREPFLTGKGVLVAVIDSGIDYQNPEFRTREGETRIQYLWDQTLIPSETIGFPPAGFSEGVEFDKAKIDAALRSNMPETMVPSFDTSKHGTSVAAIAAAGGNLMDGRFEGVAPESELIVVNWAVPFRIPFPEQRS